MSRSALSPALSEIVSAAADREQASIVFEAASSMVQASPVLSRVCTVLRKEIVTKSGARYRAISADAQDVGSGSESLAADVSGDAIQIAFNVRYVLEGLKAMGSERVELRCNAPTTPVVLASAGDDAFTYLVMPVQIRQ